MSLPAPAAPLFPHKLLDRRDVGGGLWLVAFEAGPGHEVPGQYTWIEAGGVGGYFVLASRPGASVWEVIVRGGGGAADALIRGAAEDPLASTGALGRGFPCEATVARELIVAVPASAVAVARPVIEWRIERALAASTTLLLGAQDKIEVALADELQDFRARGVDVTVCLSREDPAGEPGFASGWVQDVARAKVDRRPVFFVAGHTKAEAGVREAFAPLGLEIHSNY